MFLHITPPDIKFTPKVIELYEAARPNQNRFALVSDNKSPFDYQHPAIIFKDTFSVFERCFLDLVADADMIFMHFMDIPKLKLLGKIPRDRIVIWHSWGPDIVHAISPSPDHANHKESTRLLLTGNSITKYAVSRFKDIVKGAIDFRDEYRKLVSENIGRINAMSTVSEIEYSLMKREYKANVPDYIKCEYGYLDNLSTVSTQLGINILVGNSSFGYNNHIEVFKLLRRLNLKDRKILVPLSYGYEEYRHSILEEGKRILGRDFEPILDFKPFEEYRKIMESCGFFISNSKVQMAAGNIYIALGLGMKVFLDKRNPLFHDAQKQGLAVHSINDLEENGTKALTPLSDSEKKKNGDIVIRMHSKEFVLKQYKEIFDKFHF
jgi:dTDP-N-acetylfucosamine:lipid II N-acetylfucosaminyltransferase